LAGVEVVTPISKPRRKSDREVIELLADRADSAGIVDEVSRRPAGVMTSDVCEALGRTPQELGDDFERLKGQGAILGFAGMWLSPAAYTEVAERVRAATLMAHNAEPRNPSVPKAAVLKESGLGWPPKSFDRLIASMDGDGLIVLHGAEMRHPEFRVRLSDKQEALLNRVLAEMRAKAAIAPSAREIGEALAVPPQAVEEMWRLGVATGRMVRVDEGLYYAPETLEEIKAKVRSLGERFTVADFRDATGSSRKYALPLLIYFDELKFTRRVGDERIVLN
jgi:selenocysteine-specific elongation factor